MVGGEIFFMSSVETQCRPSGYMQHSLSYLGKMFRIRDTSSKVWCLVSLFFSELFRPVLRGATASKARGFDVLPIPTYTLGRWLNIFQFLYT